MSEWQTVKMKLAATCLVCNNKVYPGKKDHLLFVFCRSALYAVSTQYRDRLVFDRDPIVGYSHGFVNIRQTVLLFNHLKMGYCYTKHNL